MRFVLARTDALGDLIISLPVQERILSRDPTAEIHWLVAPANVPLLQGHPGCTAVHARPSHEKLLELLSHLRPDALLNLGHRDRPLTVAAKRAGIPIRVARARGLDQIQAATHRIWAGRCGTGRHEAQNVLDFLHPWGWAGGIPSPPRLRLTPEERAQGERDLADHPRPRLGVVLRGSGSGAFPSSAWWNEAIPLLRSAGWTPITLCPAEASDLPPTDLRGLMARLAACQAVLSPSTGPAHLAAALGVPVLALMGKRPNHGPDRWAPLGDRVQILTYPGPEADLQGGLDRLDPHQLLPHLARLA